MNNKEFISRLAQRTGYSQVPTQRMVTNVIDAMSDAFQDGDSLSIDGFGLFEVKKKMEDRKSVRVGKECRSRWSPYH